MCFLRIVLELSEGHFRVTGLGSYPEPLRSLSSGLDV